MLRTTFSAVCVSLAATFTVGLSAPNSAGAADDPTIPADTRQGVQEAMDRMIRENTVDERYWIYDPVANRLAILRFKELHEGIVRRGAFYVSCADFVDDEGRVYDLDFLVLPNGESYRAVQAVIHAVDGEKRKYHLEE